MSGAMSCSICMEIFKRGDDVICTLCGHVYHKICIQSWAERSRECPQCRDENRDNRKIYPIFEDPSAEEEKIRSLNTMLEQSVRTASEVQLELDENRSALQVLRERCGAEEAEWVEVRQTLQAIITEKDQELARIQNDLEQSVLTVSAVQQQLDESEKNFVLLEEQNERNQDQLKAAEEEIKCLSAANGVDGSTSEPMDNSEENFIKIIAENRVLKAINAKRAKDITAKTVEIKKLQDKLVYLKASAKDTTMKEQLTFQAAKLKQLTLELQKQIKINAELQMDKMKLQNHRLVYRQYVSPSAASTANGIRIQGSNGPVNGPLEIGNSEAGAAALEPDPSTVVSVVVRGLKELDTRTPKNFILKLASKVDLVITESDILEASIMERKYNARHNLPTDVFSMLVKFKTLDLKIKFLGRKDKLKECPDTKHLIIYEYNDEHTHELYHHAKHLRKFGYQSVFCRNNICYVRKNELSTPIRVFNKEQVEDLMKAAGGSFPKLDLKSPFYFSA